MRPLQELDEQLLCRQIHAAIGEAVAEDGSGSPLVNRVWNALVTMDAFAYGLPIEDGGLGLGERMVLHVCEALGQYAVPVPYAATVAVAEMLAKLAPGDDGLESLIRGDDVALFTLAEHAAANSIVAFPPDRGGLGSLWLLRTTSRGAELRFIDGVADAMCSHDDGRHESYVVFDDGALGRLRPRWRRLADAATAEIACNRMMLRQAALILGLATGSKNQALSFARDRSIFKRKLTDLQSVALRLAALHARESVTRMLLLATGSELDASQVGIRARQALAMASELCRDATRVAMQLHGSYGLRADGPMHNYYMFASIERARFGREDAHWHAAGAARLAEAAMPPAGTEHAAMELVP